MKDKFAIVGDIHGNSSALIGLLEQLVGDDQRRLIFVGDYVDRGPDSAGVIDALVNLSTDRPDCVFVAGNHDLAFLRALTTGSLIGFLSIGGASTVLSYVPEPKGDVAASLRSRVPPEHVSFLERMCSEFRGPGGLVVTHGPRADDDPEYGLGFHVYGHVPQRTGRPWIGPTVAAIDTGCGTLESGRLTALFYPERSYVQVDPLGIPVN